jgi:Domain of unknown function (DUF4396)
VITTAAGLPMWGDTIVEYVIGFGFGLLVLQALFMRDMLGGSYIAAVKATVVAEWVSMNCVMAGMVPVMVILRTHVAGTTDVSNLRFWGVLSLAVFTEMGSAEVSRAEIGAIAVLTLVALAAGVLLAAIAGDFSM